MTHMTVVFCKDNKNTKTDSHVKLLLKHRYYKRPREDSENAKYKTVYMKISPLFIFQLKRLFLFQ